MEMVEIVDVAMAYDDLVTLITTIFVMRNAFVHDARSWIDS
jgi:hypothetical protein